MNPFNPVTRFLPSALSFVNACHSRANVRTTSNFAIVVACALASFNAAADTSGKTWYSGFSNAFGISAQAVPGGVAVIDVGPEILPLPKVHWSSRSLSRDVSEPIRRRVLVQKNAGRWLAVVGIPLNTPAGKQTLEVHSTVARTQTFNVSGKTYPVQMLSIQNKRKVNPNPDDVERIARESGQMSAAKEHWSENFLASEFVVPAKGRVSSRFGLRRIYNGQPRLPHAGLDIAAPEGDPIIAAAKGVVIEVGDFFFNGQSVFIDHGHGLISLYSHMSRIDVIEGQTVEAGQEIGDIGSTGRVTGAHLHWSVALNGVWVDPLLLLAPDLNPDQPVSDQPVSDQPVSDQPVSDQPVSDQGGS